MNSATRQQVHGGNAEEWLYCTFLKLDMKNGLSFVNLQGQLQLFTLL